MSLEEKIGQLFIIGIPQKAWDRNLDRFVAKYKPGSFLLFKRNIESIKQIKQLNKDIYKNSFKHTKLPPLIAIDQEGGAVSRLPLAPPPPNALAVGQTKSPALAEEFGRQTGLFLNETGFNLNLAPVLDVANPNEPSFIGVRSFGSQPELVGEFGLAFSRGLLSAQVLPTAKHFPGTGNTHLDPHSNIVFNTSEETTLNSIDLAPYSLFASLGENSAVMLSHLIYPALDAGGVPASFSEKIVKKILRGRLGFKGLVLTDDLQMQGSRKLLSPQKAALRALQAGADIVMLSWSSREQAATINYVKEKVKAGHFDIKDVNERVARILKAKSFVNNSRRPKSKQYTEDANFLTSYKYEKTATEVLETNLLDGIAKLETYRSPTSGRAPSGESQVCIISSSIQFVESFNKSAKKAQKYFTLTVDTIPDQLTRWIRRSNCELTLSIISGRKTAKTIMDLPIRIKNKLLLINLSSPSVLPSSKKNDFIGVIQLYYSHRDAGKKIAQHLDDILRKL